jgi:hypothetical protein
MRVIRRRTGGAATGGNKLGALMVGALAGVALGMFLADRGALDALRRRVAGGVDGSDEDGPDHSGDDSEDAEDFEDRPPVARQRRRPPAAARPFRAAAPPAPQLDEEEELEARVLETFRNDPILVDRPIDIGAIGTGIIELTGWVDAPQEVRHATTLTRGTIGVHTVVNRLLVRDSAPTPAA